jgi:hypothetical protein
MSGSLDDAGNSLVLQRRQRREKLVVARWLAVVYTSVGGRLRDRAVRLTLSDRLIEQDEVLLGRQVQVLMLLLQLLRGWGRQARRTGGKPC